MDIGRSLLSVMWLERCRVIFPWCWANFGRSAATAVAILLILVLQWSVGTYLVAGERNGRAPLDGASLSAVERLVGAYPEFLSRVEDGELVWRDGTRSPVREGSRNKSFEQKLSAPDILDMVEDAYPAGPGTRPPVKNFDPGRFRNQEFFIKVYGDCRKGEVARDLVDVAWLPKKTRYRVRVTKRNGVAARLRAVSAELDALDSKYTKFLVPPGGGYNCRTIAGTSRLSAHSFGIAVDISVKRSHYWRWSKGKSSLEEAYRNDIPWEIVKVFEKHGFIWGGKWSHFDTMHFEYRPELIAPKR